MIVRVSPGGAATCDVPSASYPSIQSAVDVINCTEIVVASGSFYENLAIGRTLEIHGVSSDTTRVVGKVTVEGFGTKATLKGLTIAVAPEDQRWTPIFGQVRGVSKVESSGRFMPRGSGESSLGSRPRMTLVRD